MLLQFSCTNHKSIYKQINFSMLASKDNSNEEELKEYNGIRILRNAAIYGANGSGKSSFIESIGYLQKLIINSVKLQPGDVIIRKAHKLSEENQPSNYDVQFIYENVRYAYGVSLIDEKIIEEYLYYFPNGKQAKIFERKNDDLFIGDKFKRPLEISKGILKPNRLFLSCAANFSNVKEIENAFLFFKEQIVMYQRDYNNWLEYSVNTLEKNPIIKKIFMNFMKSIQPGLCDISIKRDKKNLNVDQIAKNFPEELQRFLKGGEAEVIDVKLDYGKFIIGLNDESNGIQKLFELLCPIIDILFNGKILICDEIETSLHPNIVLEIIKLFKYSRKEEFAQLIFSTHDTSLLDLNLFRRDQIWFTELKPEDRSTDLYSLAELKNVRKDENVCKGYISGKYGAIPMLNANLIEDINKETINIE